MARTQKRRKADSDERASSQSKVVVTIRKRKVLETEPVSEAEPALLPTTHEEPEKQQTSTTAKRRKTTAKTGQDTLPAIPQKHVLAGKVYVCGQGDSGQLGLGNLIPDNDEDEDLDDPSEVKLPRHSPVDEQDSDVVQVAAGGMHSVALTADGRVFTSGVNDEAALGRCTDAAIWEAERTSGAAAADAYKWGQVEVPEDFGKIVKISAGDSHTSALTVLGAVWAWGLFRGNSGPYGFAPGDPHALKPKLVYRPTSAADQVLSISSGADHVLACRRDGSVMSWGYGEQGQLGRLGSRLRDPEKTMLQPAEVPLHKIQGYRKRFKAESVAAGSFGSFVIAKDGTTVAFGVNASGQLGLEVQGNTVDSNIFQRPTRVAGLQEGHAVRSISAGKSHTLAFTEGGGVLSFGLQTYGRLGRTDANVASDASLPPGPVSLQADASVRSIAAGHDTSASVTQEGVLYTWGMGTNYQLCRKSDNDVSAPFKVKFERFEPPVTAVGSIAFGGQHTLLTATPAL